MLCQHCTTWQKCGFFFFTTVKVEPESRKYRIVIHRSSSFSINIHIVTRICIFINATQRLRWSRGSVVPKFAGSNPAEAVGFFRAVTTCKRSLNLRGSRNLGKITTGHLSHPQFHLSLLGSLASLRTQRHVATKVGTSKGGGKQWQTTPNNLPRMQCAKSHIGSITGLWLLPDRPLGLNTNEWMKTQHPPNTAPPLQKL